MEKRRLKRLICFFRGHRIEHQGIIKPYAVYSKHCSRCMEGLGTWEFNSYNCPPPPRKGISEEERKRNWEDFLDSKYKGYIKDF